MCHNVGELVKNNTKYCCKQPDIMGDKMCYVFGVDEIFFVNSPIKWAIKGLIYIASTSLSCKQPDIMGDKIPLANSNFLFSFCRQPDIMGDKD